MKKSILLILTACILNACASTQPNIKIANDKANKNSSDKLDVMMIQTMQMRDSFRNF